MVEPLFEDNRGTDSEAQKSLWRNLNLLWSFRYVYLLSLGVCGALGYLYLKATVPVYRVEASLMVENPGSMSQESRIFETLGMGGGQQTVENEVEILKSKSLIRQAVRELNLEFRYWSPGWIRDQEQYGRDLPFQLSLVPREGETLAPFTFQVRRSPGGGYMLDYEENSWPMTLGAEIELPMGRLQLKANPQGNGQGEVDTWKGEWTPTAQAGNRFRQSLQVAPVNQKVDLISIQLLDPLAKRATDLVDQLMEVYLESKLEEQNRAARSTLQFIDERLEIVARDLKDIEDQVESFKESRSLMDLTEQSRALMEESQKMRQHLLDQEVQLELLESLNQFLSAPTRTNDPIPIGLGTMDPGLQEVIKNYNELQQQRSQLALSFTAGSPQLEALDRQILALRAQVAQHVDGIRRNREARVQTLRAQSSALQSRIKRVPGTEREFVEIYRQQKIKQELYMYLLTMREETALSRSGTLAGARVIDAAERRGGPVSPNRPRIYMASLALGLIIPSAFLLGRTLLNRRIEGREDVERRTSIPLLGMISQSPSAHPLVVEQGSRSVIAEQFRTVRTNLQFFHKGSGNQVLLVSSSMSGEGKSFFSLNLASTLALSGKRILLVELDLRKPRMARDLDLPSRQGMSHYLIGKADWKAIRIQDQPGPNLDFIAAGYLPPNPAELLLSTRMETFLQEVREEYDLVVLDTAPLGLVTDAHILSPLTDLQLFVVRDRYTYKQQVEQLEAWYKQKKFSSMGLILNGMPSGMTAYYGVKEKEGRGYFDT